MTQQLYRIFLTAIIALLSVSAYGAELTFSSKEAATVGVRIVNLSTGKVVASENSDKAMIPASILKSVTTATALNAIGTDYTYKTKVEYSGSITDSILNGNIIVRASGDPTIDSQFFPDNIGFAQAIIDKIVSLGIKQITGDVIVDEGEMSDTGQNPQWVIEDTGWAYGAGYYNFNYSDNIFNIYTASLETKPEVPYIDVILQPENSSLDVFRGVNSDIYVISGRGLSKAKQSVSTTMNSPSTVFTYNLVSRLNDAGITVEGSAIDSDTTTELLTWTSPKSIDIYRSLMVRSDNMMAEAVLRSIAPNQTRKAAISAELAYWKSLGVTTSYLRILDGSGLARGNRVTPRFISDVLSSMAKGRYSDAYVKLFPKVGKEGTVEFFLNKTRLKGKLVLKSGSMNGVHCYAGYKIDSNGKPTHSVVIMVNNFFCSRATLRKAMETFLLNVF